MIQAYLEHTNLTVRNPDKTAELLCQLFGWKVRWSGPALDEGYTVHVGNNNSYLALYAPRNLNQRPNASHLDALNLNHLGVVVDDLDAVEAKADALGLKSFNHRNYVPGHRCFYFKTSDNLEIEVISYENTAGSEKPVSDKKPQYRQKALSQRKAMSYFEALCFK